MHEFWYDQSKQKYGEKAKLCYMDSHIKRDHLYSDIAKDVKATFNTSNYELDRPLPKEESIKESGLMKDEFLY